MGEKAVRRYVRAESAAGSDRGLKFVRTADIDDVRYWLWEMDDDGERAFDYIEEYEGSVLLSMNWAKGPNAEQFLVHEHLKNQYPGPSPAV